MLSDTKSKNKITIQYYYKFSNSDQIARAEQH